jgi:very-short-patch-repair endonuclease
MSEDLMRERARAMRREPTEAERRLWGILRGQRLAGFKFRRQATVGPYIVDFLCHAEKLIIELDGGQHAESERDRCRDAWFERRGYRVLRFWNTEMMTNRDGVVFAIGRSLSLDWTP